MVSMQPIALGLIWITAMLEALCWTGRDYPSISESTIQDTVLPWLYYAQQSSVTGFCTGKKALQVLSICHVASNIKSKSDFKLCLMSFMQSVTEQLADCALLIGTSHLAFAIFRPTTTRTRAAASQDPITNLGPVQTLRISDPTAVMN